MFLSPLFPLLAYLATASAEITASQQQPFGGAVAHRHVAHPAILESIDRYPDPVEALTSLEPDLADFLATERLLHVAGADSAVWMTEGDKLRLKRDNAFFVDITDRPDATLPSASAFAGKAHMPDLDQQRFVRPCFQDVSTTEMRMALTHLTGFYNRYYHSTTGERSARWLHDHIAEIIAASPFQTYISLNYHTHTFPQPSLVARFEPPHLNASLPLTIIGAHQDSANYLFPLLPAPGADDDGSGTVSILEAFRVLAKRGFVPRDGPVEFHWYAAEEAGLLGSLDVAGYKKDRGEKVGAMMEFDMTAFIARNVNESITLVKTQADADLTEWCAKLAREYIDLPVEVAELGPNAGSDYMSWTRLGYPSAFACEGDPLHGGFPGDFDPYVHGDKDVIDIDNDRGVFSFNHMARFSELAIAFVVEQAGWSLKHTRAEDGSKPLWDTMSL